MTKHDWTACFSPNPASTMMRCPACAFERPLSDDVAYCEAHGLALVEPRFLATRTDDLLGRTLAARYVVRERLASGATSAVYRARDLVRGTDVALKVVPSKSPFFGETRQRFAREAEAMKVLESAHTVRVFDSGETEDGDCFLAMELLVGETLGARLKRGALPPALALRILDGALRSIAEAHDKGIIHRDLKPENLFLVSDLPGRPDFCKVLDFGIAKLNDDAFRPRLTERGTVLGTPRYMSPEQAQGLAVDERSDLYSLGVIAFQMLTGAPPFMAADPVLVMAKHVRELPPSVTEAAPQLASAPKLVALVRKLLSKSPVDRPQNALELLAELGEVRRELGLLEGATTSRAVALTSSAARRRSATLTSYLALSGACLAFIALGWLAKLSGDGQKVEARGAALGAPPGDAPLPSVVASAEHAIVATPHPLLPESGTSATAPSTSRPVAESPAPTHSATAEVSAGQGSELRVKEAAKVRPHASPASSSAAQSSATSERGGSVSVPVGAPSERY